MARPVLVVCAGFPGTGKTYLARRLAERVPLAMVQSDYVRRLIFPRASYVWWESEWTFRVCHQLIAELLAARLPTLFDATNLAERFRRPLYEIAEGTAARLIVVLVVAPPAVVQQRLADRSAQRPPDEFSEATWEIYERMRTRWEPIRRPHFVVDTTQDIEPALTRIVAEMVDDS